jgi:uncharacterized membrane protein YqhA
MKHIVTIDSQREQCPQWKQLVETVTFLVGRFLVAIVVVMLMVGLSLAFVGPGNAAHAAPAKSLTQAMAAITTSKNVGGPHHRHHHHHHHHHHHRPHYHR